MNLAGMPGKRQLKVNMDDLELAFDNSSVTADMIVSGFGDRFIKIPRSDSREGYNVTESYCYRYHRVPFRNLRLLTFESALEHSHQAPV